MTGRLAQARLAVDLRRRLRSRPADPHRLLVELRDHATARSPFYRRHHAGLDDAPLDRLPPVTKADLVDHLDELVTDPRVRASDLARHMATATPGTPFLGRYRVGVTSGSTGQPAVLLYDRSEWVDLLANAATAQALSRLAGAPPRARSAKVGSSSGWHLSAQVGATLADPRRPTLRLPATTPLAELVAGLVEWQPDVLTAYPSVLGLLAGEQLAGALRIAPRRVLAGGEALTADLRQRARDAWAVEVVDQYVLGEAGFVAVECEAHDGLHVLDQHALVEIVDDDGAAVEDGWGTRVLLTVLPSRTVPLVRYEVTDRARWLAGDCPCGRPSRRLAVDGRARTTVTVGGAAVHPAVFSGVLDTQPVGAWQVAAGAGGVHVRVTRPRDGFDPTAVEEAVARALTEHGAPGPVRVEVVDAIERGPGGKASLVVEVP
jgi:phenylacetate-coenzyme A ligase PaaK-like adenylate-forming protein